MELSGVETLPIGRERVWAALMDVDTLRRAIPGCEALEVDAVGAYRIVVVAAIGPVRARFKGRLQQHDLQPPQRYTLSFEGDGGLAGFARGSAEVELAESEGQTRLSYRAQSQIGGRLAQIGSRLIDASAKRLSSQFFERLAATILAPIPAPAAAPTPDGVVAHRAVASSPAGAPFAQPLIATTGQQVTIQMPAWAWAVTVAALALVAGWIGAH